jgi:hypothetical protein
MAWLLAAVTMVCSFCCMCNDDGGTDRLLDFGAILSLVEEEDIMTEQ